MLNNMARLFVYDTILTKQTGSIWLRTCSGPELPNPCWNWVASLPGPSASRTGPLISAGVVSGAVAVDLLGFLQLSLLPVCHALGWAVMNHSRGSVH